MHARLGGVEERPGAIFGLSIAEKNGQKNSAPRFERRRIGRSPHSRDIRAFPVGAGGAVARAIPKSSQARAELHLKRLGA
jgi:hypothetical protein